MSINIDLDSLPFTPEGVEFIEHPHKCGSLVYANEFFVAIIGGAECSCMPQHTFRMYDLTFLNPDLPLPEPLMEKACNSREEVLDFAKTWVADMNKTIAKALRNGGDFSQEEEEDTRSITQWQDCEDKIYDMDNVKMFSTSEKRRKKMTSGEKPIFSFPMFTKKPFEA